MKDNMKLKPFFSFFGSKWRIAPKYPAPQYGTIVEPFAGSAGYSLRYPERQVHLYDADPIIAGLWEYLIHVSEADIRALPTIVNRIDDHPNLIQEAKWLIGFWLNKGTARPMKSMSAWGRGGTHTNSFWGEKIKARIESQIQHIRHWKVANCSYADVPREQATWLVDPPYEIAGKHYRVSNVNYKHLSTWCQTLPGQVMVCENVGATWLRFEPFLDAKGCSGTGRSKVSREALWYRESLEASA